MAHKIITDDCIECAACEDVCPNNAISAGDGTYIIASNICNDCGECVNVCPVGCIKPE